MRDQIRKDSWSLNHTSAHETGGQTQALGIRNKGGSLEMLFFEKIAGCFAFSSISARNRDTRSAYRHRVSNRPIINRVIPGAIPARRSTYVICKPEPMPMGAALYLIMIVLVIRASIAGNGWGKRKAAATEKTAISPMPCAFAPIHVRTEGGIMSHSMVIYCLKRDKQVSSGRQVKTTL